MKEVIIKLLEKPNRILFSETKKMMITVNGKKVELLKTWIENMHGEVNTSIDIKEVTIKLTKEEKSSVEKYAEDFIW